MLIKHQANSRKFIQQTFLFLRVHQYPLIEQLAEVNAYATPNIITFGCPYCTCSTVEHTKCAKYYRHEKSKVESVVLVTTEHSLCCISLVPVTKEQTYCYN